MNLFLKYGRLYDNFASLLVKAVLSLVSILISAHSYEARRWKKSKSSLESPKSTKRETAWFTLSLPPEKSGWAIFRTMSSTFSVKNDERDFGEFSGFILLIASLAKRRFLFSAEFLPNQLKYSHKIIKIRFYFKNLTVKV